jgi:hypothetical protein
VGEEKRWSSARAEAADERSVYPIAIFNFLTVTPQAHCNIDFDSQKFFFIRLTPRQADHIPIKPPDVPVPPVVDTGVLLLLHYPARSCLIVITLLSHAHIHFHSCVSVFCSCTRRPSRPSVVCVPTPPQLVQSRALLVTLNVV